MSRPRTIILLSEAVSPITHMAGTAGNVALLAREPVVTAHGVQRVPFLTGNALRHSLVRRPGWSRLVDDLGLRGSLTLDQANFLFHGGSLTVGGATEDLPRNAEWRRLFPLGALLGGCLPDQILPGTLKVHRGVLICRENVQAIRHDLGAAADGLRFRAAADFLGAYQYTRGDAGKACAIAADGDVRENSNMMIYSGETIVAGSAFVHGFTLADDGPVHLGALAAALDRWAASGGTIGGMAARGHGRLRAMIVGGASADEVAEGLDAYRGHVEAHRDECAAWLARAFAPRPADPKPARGRRKGTAAVGEPSAEGA